MVLENTRFMNQTIGEQAEKEFLIRHTNRHPFAAAIAIVPKSGNESTRWQQPIFIMS